MANSASGPAWTPEEVVTVTRSSSPGSATARAAPNCSPAPALRPWIHAEARRAADKVDQPLARAPGNPEHNLGALQRVLPALVVERPRRPCR